MIVVPLPPFSDCLILMERNILNFAQINKRTCDCICIYVVGHGSKGLNQLELNLKNTVSDFNYCQHLNII